MDKCQTILFFDDGIGSLKTTLESFVSLEVGDNIDLPISVGEDNNPDPVLRCGVYSVKGIERVYLRPRSEGVLHIIYRLSRVE